MAVATSRTQIGTHAEHEDLAHGQQQWRNGTEWTRARIL